MGTATLSPTTRRDDRTRQAPINPTDSLPLRPLWEVAVDLYGPDLTYRQFADAIGFNVRAVTRWREDGTEEDGGRVPWVSADRAACALRVPTFTVWGYDWLNVRGDYDEIASGAYDREIDRALASISDDIIGDLASDLI